MRIILVQIGRIGDAVLMTPVIRALSESSQNIMIYVLTSKSGAAILKKNPRLTKVFIFRKNPLSILFLILRLRFRHFDWWIDPKDHYSKSNSFLAKASGVKNKVGFNRDSRNTFSVHIPSDKDNFLLHSVERNFQSVRFLGLEIPADIRPELYPDTVLQKKIQDTYKPDPKDTVLMNISAHTFGRHWLIEKWAFVVTACFEKHFKVIVTFHPKDYALAKSLKEQVPGIILFKSNSINDIVALMPLVGLVITPDTSIVHIAGAFNVPQIAIFSKLESNLNKFRPLSDKYIVIQPKDDTGLQSVSEFEVVKSLEKIFPWKE